MLLDGFLCTRPYCPIAVTQVHRRVKFETVLFSHGSSRQPQHVAVWSVSTTAQGTDGLSFFQGCHQMAVTTAWHMMKSMIVMSMQSQLRSLLAESQGPAVSIFMPTHRAGQEIRQDPIRLKNLVKQAEQQLINEGTRPTEARNLLEPVAGLVEDAAFWRHQAEGLAVFRSPDVFRTYRVPFPIGEYVDVSDRFYIKPLLPLLINETRFYVLALSQRAVRLTAAFQGRIATLFIPLGVRRGGRFDFNRLLLEEHDREEPGDEKLLDLVAAQTLRRGGKVYGMKPEETPGGRLLAAVYRY